MAADRTGLPIAAPYGGVLAARWLQALYDTPLLFTGILDDRGRLRAANHASIEGCGLDRDATIGRPFWECGWWSPDPELSARLRTWCRQVMRTGEPLRTESHFYLGDGTRRLVDLALIPVRDDETGRTWLVPTGLDVTAARHTHDERAAVEADALRRVADARHREVAVVQRAERRADERLHRMVAVALDLLSAETVEDLVAIMVERAVPVLGADGGAMVVREGMERLRVVVGHRLGPEAQAAYDNVPYDSPLPACWVARTGEPVLLSERAAGVAFTPEMIEVYESTGRDAWAFLPLRVGTRLLGSLAVSWREERRFRPDEITMLEAFAAQCAQALDRIQHLAAQRASALAAQRLSEALQHSLLTSPPTAGALEIAVRYQPAAHGAHVGGDWYDAFQTADGSTVLVVGDVTGHDREAVAAMGQIRNVLRGLAYDSADGPAVLLGRLDHALRGLQVRALATALLARVEPDGSGWRLRWSNAGHPPALLRGPAGGVRLLTEHDLMLGVQPAAPRREQSVRLPAGSTLVLCTDGLVERRNDVLDQGIADLTLRLEQVGDADPERLCDLLLELAPNGHEDDIALLVMRCGRPTTP
ncbi:SpoIIE family protein phosphatase [Micromonospora auratinigra]|uniref:PAS domain S-box-containing protein n=1 Tax=Micromonospora auratinigra TaxID=261654 RepID=A0A1A8Z0W7_9ACTN|nr:SpoIIE family protein phosphatase [Micromonospora auratinigra]SBT37440.1 PAS domain S-box-containing protein [Micromonospora auratinigra]